MPLSPPLAPLTLRQQQPDASRVTALVSMQQQCIYSCVLAVIRTVFCYTQSCNCVNLAVCC